MVQNVTSRWLLQTWKCLEDDMDCYESCMDSTKVTYVNSFSRGSNLKISHGLFLTNSQRKHFVWIYIHPSDPFKLQFFLKANYNISIFLADAGDIENLCLSEIFK